MSKVTTYGGGFLVAFVALAALFGNQEEDAAPALVEEQMAVPAPAPKQSFKQFVTGRQWQCDSVDASLLKSDGSWHKRHENVELYPGGPRGTYDVAGNWAANDNSFTITLTFNGSIPLLNLGSSDVNMPFIHEVDSFGDDQFAVSRTLNGQTYSMTCRLA